MNILKPNKVCDSVASVDLNELKQSNIKGILLDIDNTLIDMFKTIPPKVKEWILSAKEAGFKLMVLTNTNRNNKIELVKNEFGLDVISFAKKPSKSGFRRASEKLGLKFEEICMIGDQVLTDVLGANRVGMFSIYVEPINKKEYWYTAWKRSIESLILKHYGY